MPQTIVPTTGTRMTDITLIDAQGEPTTLDSARDGVRSVIFFLRAPDCPICLAHSRKLLSMSAAGDLGDARVILIVPGGADDAKAAEARVGGDARVYSSQAGHADVGLGMFLMLQHSGTFVVDETGVVLMSISSAIPTSSFSSSKVIAALAVR